MMKRRLIVIVLFTIAVSVLYAPAQNIKRKGTFDKDIKKATVETANDSLSYALGINVAIQGGLHKFLQTEGIMDDPVKRDLFFRGLRESLPAKEKKSAYILGLSVGDQTVRLVREYVKEHLEAESPDDVNYILVARAMEDLLSGKDKLIDDTDAVMYRATYKSREAADEKRKEEYKEKIEEETAFLEKNKTKEGVVTLPSGLQYKIIIQGDGEIPGEADIVKVSYKGRLTDESVFDENSEVEFPVNKLIKGWTEALQLMPVGSKWELFLPYNLAYGGSGHNPDIPPYSTLVFDLELLGIKEKE